MRSRVWMTMGLAVLATAAAVTWVLYKPAPPGSEQSAGQSAGSGWRLLWPFLQDPAASEAHADPVSLTPDHVRARLFEQGAFSGAQPVGEWCVQDERFRPCPGLRQRFDYYILAIGDAAPGDIRRLTADEARQDNGDKLAADIMAIWDKYWRLRTYPWRNPFDKANPATWRPALEEQQLMRREVLGEEWARAFFGDEEKRFKAQYEAQYDTQNDAQNNAYDQTASSQRSPSDAGKPVPRAASSKDPGARHAERVARYGQAAADRLAKADQAWADWERRLALARKEWARLQASPELSDSQRRQAIQRHIDEHFTTDEQVRVKALLHL